MKKVVLVFLGVFFLLLLSIPEMSFAYDSSPSGTIVIPEAIWAAATGGGTWTTEIQVYTRTAAAAVTMACYFMDQTTGVFRGPFSITGPDHQRMVRYTNILQTIQNLDAAYTYYGRVGALWINVVVGNEISVQARNTHSNGYGKTINGVSPYEDGNFGFFNPYRALMIQGIYNGAVYRSTVVLFNPSPSSISVQVALINQSDTWLGWENFTVPGYGFRAFDPFARWGVTGVHTTCRIWVNPWAGTGKIMAIGATANNTTNDPSAHIAIQYD